MPISVDCAIVPAAGFGTRLRPLTLAIPKEMLPLGRKPVLEYVLEEIRAAGIRDILFVISPAKEMIRTYFASGERWGVRCSYAVQPEMRGLGNAILCGNEWRHGRPAAIAFGDTLIESPVTPPLARLVETFAERHADAAVLTECVELDRTRRYGILAPASPVDPAQHDFRVTGIVEKPAPEDAPSRWAVAARYVLSDLAISALRSAAPGPNGEVGVTDTIRSLTAEGAGVWACPLNKEEYRRDIGGWDTYLEAAARAAISDPDYGSAIRQALLADAARAT